MIVRGLWWVVDRIANWLADVILCNWDDDYMEYDYPIPLDRQQTNR